MDKQLPPTVVRYIIITGSSDMGYKHFADLVYRFINVPITRKQLILLSDAVITCKLFVALS